MELTKLVRQITVAAFALAVLGGCTKQDGATPITTSGRGVSPTGSAALANGRTLNGWVFSPGNQDLFQEAVVGLVDAKAPADYVGFVSADANGTGVFIAGKVELQSGALNVSSSTRMNVRSDSALVIAVYDEYTGRTAQDGKKVEPFAFDYNQASGTVSGNTVNLRFTGATGTVTMDGSFNSNVFRGTISYDNSVRYDGTRPGAAGTLGDFEVPTCQFFRCQ
ncbi:MAG: hypothetical protein JNJ49_17525 [Bdellovibrionaceae bacterium]|nr:hypothetical protein [Pseudobdellovibrionaceae bacterium]